MKKKRMVQQLDARGIKEQRILDSIKAVNREDFLPVGFRQYAYDDVSIQTSEGVVMPRMFVLAKWLEVLDPRPDDRILLIGVDSGYILAVLSKLCEWVYAVDDNDQYDDWVRQVLKSQGVQNVSIKTCKTTEGWKSKAPFDKILITRELPAIPEVLLRQLAVGGTAVMPIGPDWSHVYLEVIKTDDKGSYKKSFYSSAYTIPQPVYLPEVSDKEVSEELLVPEMVEHLHFFNSFGEFDFKAFLDRIGDARVVLIGEASHGTSEFYRLRQELTKALIREKGFSIVAAEADWPDMELVNRYMHGGSKPLLRLPFQRFPHWMWRNEEFIQFVEWGKDFNEKTKTPFSIYGLDLYGLENAMNEVVAFFEAKDPEMARMVKEHYSCISPFMTDPAEYGKMVLSNQLRSCEREVLNVLLQMLKKRQKLNHSKAYFHAVQNARVVVDAERYYKVMYYGGADSWNLRDLHMFYTLRSLLNSHGPGSKAVVWAHNSHIGNALATEMYARGEINIGHLCREAFGDKSYHVGFGTNTGTVAAAETWGGPMKIMDVNPSFMESYERLCHRTGMPMFTLPLRKNEKNERLINSLSKPRIERAIGVIYRPHTERLSHYFHASLPGQFDEYIWIDKTSAVNALPEMKARLGGAVYHPFAQLDQ